MTEEQKKIALIAQRADRDSRELMALIQDVYPRRASGRLLDWAEEVRGCALALSQAAGALRHYLHGPSASRDVCLEIASGHLKEATERGRRIGPRPK